MTAGGTGRPAGIDLYSGNGGHTPVGGLGSSVPGPAEIFTADGTIAVGKREIPPVRDGPVPRDGLHGWIMAIGPAVEAQLTWATRYQLRLPLPPSLDPRIFASPLGIPACPSVVASAARDKQCHAACCWHANQQDSCHPIGNIVDHGMTGITRVEIDTYGLRGPVTRGVKRIGLALPLVIDDPSLFSTGDMLTGPKHNVRGLQPN